MRYFRFKVFNPIIRLNEVFLKQNLCENPLFDQNHYFWALLFNAIK